jgi:hypothetical protein
MKQYSDKQPVFISGKFTVHYLDYIGNSLKCTPSEEVSFYHVKKAIRSKPDRYYWNITDFVY